MGFYGKVVNRHKIALLGGIRYLLDIDGLHNRSVQEWYAELCHDKWESLIQMLKEDGNLDMKALAAISEATNTSIIVRFPYILVPGAERQEVKTVFTPEFHTYEIQVMYGRGEEVEDLIAMQPADLILRPNKFTLLVDSEQIKKEKQADEVSDGSDESNDDHQNERPGNNGTKSKQSRKDGMPESNIRPVSNQNYTPFNILGVKLKKKMS